MPRKIVKKSARSRTSPTQAHKKNVYALVKRTRLFLMGDPRDSLASLIDDVLDAIKDELSLKR